MRTVYKNPKELGTCIKDLVDNYLEDLITFEYLEEKVKKLVASNGESIYKDGKISSKIFPYLGNERVEILDKIIK